MGVVTLPHSPSNLKVGHRGALVVSCFYGWPDGAALRAVADAQKTVAARYGKCLAISIIPPMSGQAARDTVQMQQAPGERDASLHASATAGEALAEITLASAMVILPRGLLAVMVSSFVAAMSLLSRSRTPLKTFRTVGEAIAWLEGQPGAQAMPGAEQDVVAWLGL